MAFKNFAKLSARNQSSLISELHQLINYYGEIFCNRERVYLKNLSKNEGSIYWLEDENKKLVAAAIIDQNFRFKIDNLDIVTLGHTVSKRPGHMDRILNHVFTDYTSQSLALICRPLIAAGLQNNNFPLVSFTASELNTYWPGLANTVTDYFNTSKETLAQGLDRKQHNLYLKISPADLVIIQKNNSLLAKFIDSKI